MYAIIENNETQLYYYYYFVNNSVNIIIEIQGCVQSVKSGVIQLLKLNNRVRILVIYIFTIKIESSLK